MMRSYINIINKLTESSVDNITDDQTKFWYSSKDDRFVDHDIDTHHIKIVATNPNDFGVTSDEVSHHPHASGEYSDADDWDGDEDWEGGENWADTNDLGIFDKLFSYGWVRGGHEIDVMQYHEFGMIHHDGGIYLHGTDLKALRKCVSACIKRWSDIGRFTIEFQTVFFTLNDHNEIILFVRHGRYQEGHR